MNIKKRLESYQAFDEQVIEAVVRAAYDQDQDRIGFGVLADRYGIANEPDIIPGTDEHSAFQVLRIIPKGNDAYREGAISVLSNSLRHEWFLVSKMPGSRSMCAIGLPLV